MKKAFIFDLDGTLLHTAPDIQKNINIALAQQGLPQLSIEQVITYIGNGAAKLVERAVGDRQDLFQPVYDKFTTLYAQSDNALTMLYEGEEAFLQLAKVKGIKLAILTNKPQLATQTVYLQYLNRFGFDFVLGKMPEFLPKPNPESLQFLLQKIGVSVAECVFIGDGETDYQTAKNVGMDYVSTLWGYRTREQLYGAGARFFATSYQQLSDVLLQN